MIHVILIVILLFILLPQVHTNPSAFTDVVKLKHYISIELAIPTALFLKNTDVNGIEISVTIHAHGVGTSIGTGLVFHIVIIHFKECIETRITIVIILDLVTNIFTITKLVIIPATHLLFPRMNQDICFVISHVTQAILI